MCLLPAAVHAGLQLLAETEFATDSSKVESFKAHAPQDTPHASLGTVSSSLGTSVSTPFVEALEVQKMNFMQPVKNLFLQHPPSTVLTVLTAEKLRELRQNPEWAPITPSRDSKAVSLKGRPVILYNQGGKVEGHSYVEVSIYLIVSGILFSGILSV
jgi:hypothetical protein